MAIPRGAHYVPGSGRKIVELVNGERVSRAEAENRSARALGAHNDYEVRQARKAAKESGMYNSDHYRRDLATARQKGRMTDKEFATMAAIVSYTAKHGQLDKGVGSPLAQYQWAIGRHNNRIDYAVGETPNT